MHSGDHTFWVQIYEQTPPVARWIMGIMTGGIYLLARYIWKRQHERLAVVEAAQKKFATKTDIETINDNIRGVHQRVDALFFHFGINHQVPPGGSSEKRHD